ncbi:MAG TPA: potassium-transporting ATPase subunit KdpC [Chloroflexota bacterium]|nr:potassium-transporting ATPase subunit KdpC [Chloroflexota bacterium]
MSWLRISILFFVLLGGLYPAVVTGAGQLLFHDKAQGSIIYDKAGNAVGSELIAQAFDKDEYFHPRPSAAGADGYDATSSGGSNLGPTNQALIDRVKGDVGADKYVPADAVTTSGSGLDPDISPENALAQVARVAKARGMPEQQLTEFVNKHTIGRDLGIFGEPRVNVLRLNMDLDALKK